MAYLLGGGGGVDWSQYTTKKKTSTITPALTDTYETLLDITGEGFLNETTVSSSTTTHSTAIKITIDSTDVYEFIKSTSDGCAGLIKTSDLTFISGSAPITAVYGTMKQIQTYNKELIPATGVNGSVIYSGFFGIKFKTSLKIEVKNVTSTGGVYYSYAYTLKD